MEERLGDELPPEAGLLHSFIFLMLFAIICFHRSTMLFSMLSPCLMSPNWIKKVAFFELVSLRRSFS